MATMFYPPAYSGAGRQCALLSEGLSRKGTRVQVLTSHGRTRGMPERESPNDLLQVLRLGGSERDRRWDAYVWGLRVANELWLLREKYDITHFHSMNLWALPALLTARILNKKIIIKVTTLNQDDPPGLRQERLGTIKSRLFELANAVVGNSPGIKDAFVGHRAAGRVVVIPNGIDVQEFHPVDATQRATMRAQLDLPQDRPIAVCVSVLTPRKGIEFLLKAWHQLKGHGMTPLLLVLGATDLWPEYTQRMQELQENLDLGLDVRFLGYLPNVADYLQAADLFVFASSGEGLPSAIIEAMSCGLPVIARRINGVSDFLIKDDCEGFILEPEDLAGFGQAIRRIVDSPDLAATMGAQGRRTVLAKFSIDQMVDQYIALYHDVCGEFSIAEDR